ncbi:MAG: peptidoglycan DD-metalloendopeptidase family protein [Anaerotignum sp.]|nr:peptidoglycan DD-metalloendopeptidase family protein [Anaerotignum sp.]MBR4113599.1 peptidoglycan DD-metalloendopeptidase family protein [Anaerotignum sp.]
MKHMKKILCTALAVVMTCSLLPSYTAGAATYAELQAKRQSLAASTNNAKKEIEKLKDKQGDLEDDMAVLDKGLQSMQEEYDAAKADLDFLTARLDEAQAELDEATANREAQFALLGDRMKFLQQKGSTGYLEILLESESFSDLFLRMQYVNDIMGYDKEILDELQTIQDTIQERTDEIAENHAEQQAVVDIQEEKMNEMEAVVAQKKALWKSYESDLAKYEKLVKANEANDAAILRQMNASASPTAVYTGSGKFQWPVPASSRISSEYGYRTSPISGKREFHNGLDIPAPYGSAIVATEAGTVTYSGWMNGYGYTIIIDHGSGITSLYGHNSSLVVKKGAKVSKGQTIAKCGSTGWSTGNHCHFTISVKGSAVNPHNYVG